MLQGSETPRLFTSPARPLTPDTTRGYEAIDFAEQVLGLALMPWQRWLLLHGLELNVETEQYEEGGENGFVHKFPGRMSWPNITLFWRSGGSTSTVPAW